MDTIELAWYAGFMDGEGTITIKRYNRVSKIAYLVMCSCTQVDKYPNNKIIESFKERFGGTVYRYTQKPKDKNWIDSIQWAVASSKAIKFLTQIKPFLRLKDKQADVALELISGLRKNGDSRKLSLKEDERRGKLFDKMRTLNVKGKLHLQRLNEETAKADVIV